MRGFKAPVAEGLVELTSPFRPPGRPDHHGADFFPVPRGRKLPVLAFDGGAVVLAQNGNRTAGNWLEILHDGGAASTYMHLDSISVAVGQRVGKGAQIGVMGMSGTGGGSADVHLHFELRFIRDRDGGRNAVDPVPFLLGQRPMTGGEAMNIAHRPSPNHAAGRQGHAPDIIVCHITNGSFPGSIDWVANPASKVSYHFMVSRAGDVTQCVDVADTAWANGTSMAAGDSRHSRNSSLAIVRDRGANANLYTVSIGFEGVHGKTNGRLPPAQVDAAARLIGHIRSEIRRLFGSDMPAARTHVVGHFEITPLTRPDCPGADFPFGEILRRPGASGEGAQAQPPAQQQAAGPPQAPPRATGCGLRGTGTPKTHGRSRTAGRGGRRPPRPAAGKAPGRWPKPSEARASAKLSLHSPSAPNKTRT